MRTGPADSGMDPAAKRSRNAGGAASAPVAAAAEDPLTEPWHTVSDYFGVYDSWTEDDTHDSSSESNTDLRVVRWDSNDNVARASESQRSVGVAPGAVKTEPVEALRVTGAGADNPHVAREDGSGSASGSPAADNSVLNRKIDSMLALRLLTDSSYVAGGARPDHLQGCPRVRGRIFKEHVAKGRRRKKGTDLWHFKARRESFVPPGPDPEAGVVCSQGTVTLVDKNSTISESPLSPVKLPAMEYRLIRSLSSSAKDKRAQQPVRLDPDGWRLYHILPPEAHAVPAVEITGEGLKERAQRRADLSRATVRSSGASKVEDSSTPRVGLAIDLPPQPESEWLQFRSKDGVVAGAFAPNSRGHAQFTTPAADFAEWHRRCDGEPSYSPGTVVGITGSDEISRCTSRAAMVGVISCEAAVEGNCPKDKVGWDLVCYVGRVSVRVQGLWKSGWWVLPSGLDDGTAVAMPGCQAAATETTSRPVFGVIAQAERREGWGSDTEGSCCCGGRAVRKHSMQQSTSNSRGQIELVHCSISPPASARVVQPSTNSRCSSCKVTSIRLLVVTLLCCLPLLLIHMQDHRNLENRPPIFHDNSIILRCLASAPNGSVVYPSVTWMSNASDLRWVPIVAVGDCARPLLWNSTDGISRGFAQGQLADSFGWEIAYCQADSNATFESHEYAVWKSTWTRNHHMGKIAAHSVDLLGTDTGSCIAVDAVRVVADPQSCSRAHRANEWIAAPHLVSGPRINDDTRKLEAIMSRGKAAAGVIFRPWLAWGSDVRPLLAPPQVAAGTSTTKALASLAQVVCRQYSNSTASPFFASSCRALWLHASAGRLNVSAVSYLCGPKPNWLTGPGKFARSGKYHGLPTPCNEEDAVLPWVQQLDPMAPALPLRGIAAEVLQIYQPGYMGPYRGREEVLEVLGKHIFSNEYSPIAEHAWTGDVAGAEACRGDERSIAQCFPMQLWERYLSAQPHRRSLFSTSCGVDAMVVGCTVPSNVADEGATSVLRKLCGDKNANTTPPIGKKVHHNKVPVPKTTKRTMAIIETPTQAQLQNFQGIMWGEYVLISA
eukprot:SAG31_NODE_1256_length_9081_cov_13.160655_8_plen_1059_part_00